MTLTERSERLSIRTILSSDELRKSPDKSGNSEEDVAKLIAPIVGIPSGVFQLSMKLGDALGKKLNLKSSKKVEKILPNPYVLVVRATAAAIGSLKYEITNLLDTPQGSAIEAKLPLDIFSLGGSLLFEIIEQGTSLVHIIGSSEIKGQLFDWGKGKRSLQDVFDKIDQYVNLLSPRA